MVTRVAVWVGALVCLVSMSAGVNAQEITGVVTDSTGGIMPGVTVEASSPALIEGTRVSVTNQTGQYRLLALLPGTYDVVFTLPGFNIVRREGIVLSANFTATVDTQLAIGGLEETVVVTGGSPIVDVQNVASQMTLTREDIEAIPTGKYYQNYGAITPGVYVRSSVTNSNQDVGGSLGNVSAETLIHGSRGRDQQILLDGLSLNSAHVNSVSSFNPVDTAIEEIVLMTGSNPPEAETGGVRFNLIPRSGGNQFSGSVLYAGTNSDLQSDNVDSGLTNAGLSAANTLIRQHDFQATLGGPIVEDKLWFFGAGRYFPNDRTVGGVNFTVDPKAFVYEEDTTRPGVQDTNMKDASFRLTWQASPKNKISAFTEYNYQCDCHRYISATTAPEASVYLQFWNKIAQATWTMPASNSLLIEVGGSYLWWQDKRRAQDEATEVSIVEQSRNIRYRSPSDSTVASFPGNTTNIRASVSYVTGGHSFKGGIQYLNQELGVFRTGPIDDIGYRALNGVANQVSYFATPYGFVGHSGPNIGLYVQDQWTIDRLTMNYGVRIDRLLQSYDDISLAPARWIGQRDFEGANTSDWWDINPRLSVAYDLTGDGKTALKGSVNRYINQTGILDWTLTQAPVFFSNNVSNRTWNDANLDGVVQGDPFNTEANGEIGLQTNLAFGQTVKIFHMDEDLREGWGKRAYNIEVSAGVQRELVTGTSVNVSYFRRQYGNFYGNDNEGLSPADYDPFCVTPPVDSRLPDGGGNEICGLFDANRRAFPRFVRKNQDGFGGQSENWNGVDITLQSSFGGSFLQGGVSTGKTLVDNCATALNEPQFNYTTSIARGLFAGNSPAGFQVGEYCREETPWLTQVKFSGAYQLPYDLQASGSYQSYPGAATYANFVATNDIIKDSLGRDLLAGPGGSVTLDIVGGGNMYLDRYHQFDFRLSKTIRVENFEIQGMIDLYNAFNSNTVITANNQYGVDGSAWLTPQVVLPGRIIKFGIQTKF